MSSGSTPTSPVLGSSPTKASGVSGVRRPNAVLARYGGQFGPTGTAAGPKSPNESPVSLANFMGGKAAGPRLGKLVGDGKSAPPEADMIHENRRVALPGLANPAFQSSTGGRSLASFLGERADAMGNHNPKPQPQVTPTPSAPPSSTLTSSVPMPATSPSPSRSPMLSPSAASSASQPVSSSGPARLPGRETAAARSDSAPPTASLRGLSVSNTVAQRIREAQQRDATAQKEIDSMKVGGSRSTPQSPSVRDRWPPLSQHIDMPARSSSDEPKFAGARSPTKYGNALPGLASRSPLQESPPKSWSTSPMREHAPAEPRQEPVRLPGMGAASSPFRKSPQIQRLQEHEETINPTDAESLEPKQVLEPLTKSRARGPVRRGAPARSTPDQAAEECNKSTTPAAAADERVIAASAQSTAKPVRRTTGKRIHVLISGSGSNLQSLIDATLLDPPAGMPTISGAQISFVLSNRKAAYGLTRAAESNPPIPTKVLALKTWQNRNPGGTREEYDQVLARAVLDGPSEEGQGAPPDLIVLAGFMHIVSEPFLHALGHRTSLPTNTPTIGSRPSKPVPIINLHPALPGAFDGANAIPRAFEAYREGTIEKTGCMVHEVVADVDRGRPIIVREVPILPSYDLDRLETEIHKIEHVIIVQAADLVLKGHLEELDRAGDANQ
ncbi:phosphoribosylglycinamide formyltransferase [Testicularia cyperi]|uniref:phosphoribosylglycinamide formyltransferase 1 n=1 Tax=Testicularia cyperi TaxID=1882483 RepID=A0A317XYX6_9BASI|nr:phosphoribosylglycinamide formyltransferase [Testicularia cyperi]